VLVAQDVAAGRVVDHDSDDIDPIVRRRDEFLQPEQKPPSSEMEMITYMSAPQSGSCRKRYSASIGLLNHAMALA
jgi:hypothetical protein